MPKYYCEYCDIYLMHSSLAGRRQHNAGRKHINNKIEYYQNLIREKGVTPPMYPAPPTLAARLRATKALQAQMAAGQAAGAAPGAAPGAPAPVAPPPGAAGVPRPLPLPGVAAAPVQLPGAAAPGGPVPAPALDLAGAKPMGATNGAPGMLMPGALTPTPGAPAPLTIPVPMPGKLEPAPAAGAAPGGAPNPLMPRPAMPPNPLMPA